MTAAMAELAVLAASMEVRQNGNMLSSQVSAEKRQAAAALVEEQRDGRYPAWSPREDDFLRQNMTRMSKAQIALHLGRTVVAIGLRRRRLALPSISAQSGLAAREVGDVLGFWGGREVSRLVEGGVLPGTRTPLGNRRLSVDPKELLRWAVRPESWIYFDADRVRVPRIQRLVKLAQERWSDEWLSLREVSEISGVSVREITRLCNEGRLPAVQRLGKRNNAWFMRRSDARSLSAFRRCEVWSPEAERFAMLAVAIGIPKQQVDVMASWPRRRTSHRLAYLHKKRLLARRVDELGAPVQVRGRCLFADWREHRDRFSALGRQMDGLRAGREVQAGHRIRICAVLAHWLAWHAEDAEAQELARRSKVTVRPQMATLETLVGELDRRGIDALGRGI
jgi:predicted DNA-binding transcriptional regulator AlpA